jgi:hypoxanthine-DNA glycosylase
MLQAFAPIVSPDSKVLILGTMPGVRSLQLQQYYGHSGNHFWRLMFALFNQPFSTDYNTRLNLLLQHKIALWDVLSHCEREGSSDSKIQNEVVNDFTQFYKKHPHIKAVFLDSTTAKKLYDKHVGTGAHPHLKFYLLPSPSGQHARMSFDEKLKAWQKIVEVLGEK